MGNLVKNLTETFVQMFHKNMVNADQRPLDDSVENVVGLQMVTLQSICFKVNTVNSLVFSDGSADNLRRKDRSFV